MSVAPEYFIFDRLLDLAAFVFSFFQKCWVCVRLCQ